MLQRFWRSRSCGGPTVQGSVARFQTAFDQANPGLGVKTALQLSLSEELENRRDTPNIPQIQRHEILKGTRRVSARNNDK